MGTAAGSPAALPSSPSADQCMSPARIGTVRGALPLVLYFSSDKSLIAIPRIDQVDRCEEEENKLPRAKVIVDSDSLTRALTLTKTARRAHGKF